MSDELMTVEPVDCPALPSINDLVPGHFWCDMDWLGVSESETTAYREGKLSLKRMREIDDIVRMAINTLSQAEVPGVRFWMARQRIMN